MQSANLIPVIAPLEADVLGLAADPQAATAVAEATATAESLRM
jgi:hypothetical protein